ncbi:MAG: tripartite tricarboxylate transporter substrate binding protein [bacterium]|nr:tripartite tricarboxylate transporter substrate binding protein [bacterium]
MMKKALKKGKRLPGIIIILVLLLAMAAPAWAEYPTKPIKMLVGFRAGGGTDTMARMLAKPLGKILGQPITVVNKPGGAGGVAATLIKNSKPDGYTIGATLLITYSFMPNFSKKVKYTKDDFTYIAALGQFQEAFVCKADKPWNDFPDLIKWAKKNPDTELTYASITPIDKLFLAHISKKEGIKFRIMPVKGGAGLVPAILGDHVDFGFSGGIHYKYLKSGEMKVLAGLPENRLTATPDVPSLHEFGYSLVLENCFMAAGPKGLPKPILDKLSAAFEKAVNDKEYQSLLLDKLHYPPFYKSPEEVTNWVDKADKFYKNLIVETK